MKKRRAISAYLRDRYYAVSDEVRGREISKDSVWYYLKEFTWYRIKMLQARSLFKVMKFFHALGF